MTLDVLQNSQMNPMDDGDGDRLPVDRGRHVQFVPGVSLQTRAPAGKRSQPEFAATAAEVVVEVGRVNVVVRAELVHGRRRLDDLEGEPPARLPDGDGLDERAGGEDAPPYGPHAAPVD